MRRATLALTLAGAVLVGGVATAQNTAQDTVQNFVFSPGNPSDFATVTLYDGDPAEFGNMLATAEMGDGAVAKRLVGTGEDDETVKYVTIEIDGEVYTVETFSGGSSKNSIYLDIDDVDRDDAMTLGEMLEEVADNPEMLAQLERTSPDVSVQLAQRN